MPDPLPWLEEQLKPCPFCGGDKLEVDTTAHGLHVMCSDCLANAYLAAWKRRASPAVSWPQAEPGGEENTTTANVLRSPIDQQCAGSHVPDVQGASGPASAPDEATLAETPKGVARSGPSRGITGHQSGTPLSSGIGDNDSWSGPCEAGTREECERAPKADVIVEWLVRCPWTQRRTQHDTDQERPYWMLRIDEMPDFMLACDTAEALARETPDALRAFLGSYIESGEMPPPLKPGVTAGHGQSEIG